MSVAAVVLAAGGGTRFHGSTHKLLAIVRDKPVVVWAIENALAAGLDETIVIAGAVDVPASGGIVLWNPHWEEGIATSLHAAIAYAQSAGHGAVVVGLGDQPLVTPEAWRTVAAATTSPIAVATYEGRRGNPVRLAAEVWPLLPQTGDEGARSLMLERPDLVGEVPCSGDPTDIDRVEDLERWS